MNKSIQGDFRICISVPLSGLIFTQIIFHGFRDFFFFFFTKYNLGKISQKFLSVKFILRETPGKISEK